MSEPLLQLPAAVEAKVKVTERDVLDWLRRRYGTRTGNGYRYVFATHVHDASGFDYRRTADAVAMDLWPSKGLELHGHEVKVSRSDWLTELRDPDKATAVGRFCDRWWLVVPDRRIVRDGELPADWGLIVAGPTTVRAVVKAPKRIAEPASRSFMGALMRAVMKTAYADRDREPPP